MKMSSKAGRRLFFISGFIFLLYSLLIIFSSISTGDFFVGHELVFLGTAVMSFCLSYLYPQFKEDDERSKRIRERGVFFSFLFILGYMIILMPLFQLKIIDLNGYQTVSLLATLAMITVFSSFVVLSKRY
ncbi:MULTISPECIES: hypothetical protein [Bacillaceae]|nr:MULTISPECIES: hypothetical protein [Bacillaceae]PZD83935.1 hypothetical protein DEJ64_13285 [Bacilli bacterium]MED4475431.1 hypothetical protein [Oceanobacillus caeni]PZD85223.1 hypothetical protein DEJ60_12700 [Bacilli bacterium]PZD88120.1 hypothetical protein DEJ66_13215 [Bacilli bacterium]RCO04468.1 hypothetical protein DTX80_16730 [Bacilli bacterium]